MKIVITGGGGFLGQRVARALLADARVERIVLADVAPVGAPAEDARIVPWQVDLAEEGAAAAVMEGAAAVFHLAAVVSGQAEAEFDVGMRVNLDGTRSMLEAARAGKRRPVFVFASSLAVFGPPLPPVVSEETAVHPQSSYGAQKAIGELLVADYSRKGYVDGRVLRLPTVCVRPGRPNAAASSFVSGIIREPLHGEKAVCPVGRELEVWLASPRATVANLVHGWSLPSVVLGARRVINLPGITVTVAAMIEALERVGGLQAAALVEFREDPVVKRIVSSWPAHIDASRALELGFVRDAGFESVVREFLADEAASGGVKAG